MKANKDALSSSSSSSSSFWKIHVLSELIRLGSRHRVQGLPFATDVGLLRAAAAAQRSEARHSRCSPSLVAVRSLLQHCIHLGAVRVDKSMPAGWVVVAMRRSLLRMHCWQLVHSASPTATNAANLNEDEKGDLFRLLDGQLDHFADDVDKQTAQSTNQAHCGDEVITDLAQVERCVDRAVSWMQRLHSQVVQSVAAWLGEPTAWERFQARQCLRSPLQLPGLPADDHASSGFNRKAASSSPSLTTQFPTFCPLLSMERCRLSLQADQQCPHEMHYYAIPSGPESASFREAEATGQGLCLCSDMRLDHTYRNASCPDCHLRLRIPYEFAMEHVLRACQNHLYWLQREHDYFRVGKRHRHSHDPDPDGYDGNSNRADDDRWWWSDWRSNRPGWLGLTGQVDAWDAAIPLPQWVQADVMTLDWRLFGNVAVVMADPPWNINMNLPYTTMKDEEIRNLKLGKLQQNGFLFLWVTMRTMELGRECLQTWGYQFVEEICWIKTTSSQHFQRFGRNSFLLNHSKEHCLVGVKGEMPVHRKFIFTDVIVSEVREVSRKPDEIYALIDRMIPWGRKVEIFGRQHNIRPGWITVGNQLPDTFVYEEDLVALFRPTQTHR